MADGRKNNGGARPGAGRKPRAEQFPEVFQALDERLAEGVPARLARLEELAEGGFEQIEEIAVPAGTVTIGSGESLQLVFPNKPADEMVVIRRVRSFAAPDRQANIYLVDRFAGRPVQATELSGPGGAPVPVDLLSALERVYGPEAGEDGSEQR